MYLAELAIKNFRRLSDVTLKFVPSLNVLVGPNNVGLRAVTDRRPKPRNLRILGRYWRIPQRL